MTVDTRDRGSAVGHYSDHEGLTGCTVVLAPGGVTARWISAAGLRGPLETALLSPYASVSEVTWCAADRR